MTSEQRQAARERCDKASWDCLCRICGWDVCTAPTDEEYKARITELEAALLRVRQGYQNILEKRKLDGSVWGQRDGYGGCYGALTREEIEGAIGEIDAVVKRSRA